VQTMVLEEYGLAPFARSPVKAALCTFGAFAVFGSIPMLPYLAGGGLFASVIATSVAFVVIGSLKSRWSVRPAWRSGLETLLIGSVAAGLAYAAGNILASLVS
jgi:VIT1/CCC1 family predicted Fe2+/Mn2+ transporter